MTFEVKARDGLARIGTFVTSHGVVTTPTLLPVVNPSITLVPVDRMRSMGTEMVITNSYIIRSRAELRERALASGVHSLVGDLPVMTDSGTFQMYMYGKVAVSNREIVEFQREIGSDVGTILDLFTLPGTPRDQADREARETLERAREGVELKGTMALAGTVQGGVFPDLREHHARELSRLDLDLHPVGGVVPLMENGWYRELAGVIIGAKRGLDPSRPVHLFGAGHPMIFPLAAYLGCDLFDSASYAKFARDDRMMFPNGTRRLADINELWCPCPVCGSLTIGELRALPPEERMRALAEHNLYISFSEIRRVRDAIRHGSLRELVEARTRENPGLIPVLRVLRDHADYLEEFEPVTRRSAFTFTGPESLWRPNLIRYRRRFSSRFMPSRRDDPRTMVMLETGGRPYSRDHGEAIGACRKRGDVRILVNSIFGPVPLELDEMYPLAQTVLPPELDPETRREMAGALAALSDSLPEGRVVVWGGENGSSGCDTGSGGSAGDEGSDGEEGPQVHGEPGEAGKPDGEWDGVEGEDREVDEREGREVGEGEGREPPGAVETGGGQDQWTADTDLAGRIERVRAVADMQFGDGARGMFHGDIAIRTSRKTGKIRNIFVDGEHMASMRAHDGLFTLKEAGARRLMELFPPPHLRVTVEDDTGEFIREGKNVFARFVRDMDPCLRPMDEVLVVDGNDHLLAIGQVILVRGEALAFNRGIAAKVRDGVRNGALDPG